jgi:hypothetical protein
VSEKEREKGERTRRLNWNRKKAFNRFLFSRMTLNSLKSTSNVKNILLLSYDEVWCKTILNLALKSGILNSDVSVIIAAFVSQISVE